MLTLDKVYHAAFVLKDVARKTDLIEAPKLSKDCQLYLKTENLQATGSFKVRGAYYKISQLSKEESEKVYPFGNILILFLLIFLSIIDLVLYISFLRFSLRLI